jgi:uncharacterized protein (DUF983 family)
MPIEIKTAATPADRPVAPALRRGLACRCPSCGIGAIFGRYLKVNADCPQCGEALHHHRADDAPPYFTMVLVGHIVVGGLLAMERAFKPETWVHLVIWLPATLLLSLWLLPRVKGALIALQWALRMHGFGGTGDAPADGLPVSSIAREDRRHD